MEDASEVTPSSMSPSEADHVDEVVERRLTGCGVRVEQATLPAGGHRHSDRGGQPLTERPGGDLHTLGVVELRVSGVSDPQVRSASQIVQFQAETAQVQLDVQGQAGMAAGQDEPVPAHPVRIGRIVPHHLLEQGVRQRGQAHRGAGMAVADLLHGIRGQHPHGVDRSGVHVRPVVGDLTARSGLRYRRWLLTWSRAGDLLSGRSPQHTRSNRGTCLNWSDGRGLEPSVGVRQSGTGSTTTLVRDVYRRLADQTRAARLSAEARRTADESGFGS